MTDTTTVDTTAVDTGSDAAAIVDASPITTATATNTAPVSSVKVDTTASTATTQVVTPVTAVDTAYNAFVAKYDLSRYSDALVEELYLHMQGDAAQAGALGEILEMSAKLGNSNVIMTKAEGQFSTKKMMDDLAAIFQIGAPDYQDVIYALLDFVSENRALYGAWTEINLNRYMDGLPQYLQLAAVQFMNGFSQLSDKTSRTVLMRQFDMNVLGAYILALYRNHATGECVAFNRLRQTLHRD